MVEQVAVAAAVIVVVEITIKAVEDVNVMRNIRIMSTNEIIQANEP
jgi:hypothetical protein